MRCRQRPARSLSAGRAASSVILLGLPSSWLPGGSPQRRGCARAYAPADGHARARACGQPSHGERAEASGVVLGQATQDWRSPAGVTLSCSCLPRPAASCHRRRGRHPQREAAGVGEGDSSAS